MTSELSMSEAPGLQQIDLTKLNVRQLSMLKQQLDQELDVFQESLRALKMAQSKFQESGSCLDKITPDFKDKDILVPLTGSMYVNGKFADVDNVLIDIGTGYYAHKNIEDAKDYFNRKVAYITTRMGSIQHLGLEKFKTGRAIMDVLEMKIREQVQKGPAEQA